MSNVWNIFPDAFCNLKVHFSQECDQTKTGITEYIYR